MFGELPVIQQKVAKYGYEVLLLQQESKGVHNV
ncbi:MAG: hypothetical protein ACD_82C00119G0002 [uncultured bacterium]|nr:MAG: hypothetical protein ACD_82C00119G0002 [uncultured bacterium]